MAAALLALSGCATVAPPAPIEPELRALVAELASDALGGRIPAGQGEAETLALITREFAAAGLTPAGTAGTWFQPVPLANRRDPTASAGTSFNVIGRLPGTAPARGAVLMMAHWDTTPTCGVEGDSDRSCNGAVDNASGTAALLAIARRIAREGPFQRDIVFVATTAEEQGLVGARALRRLSLAAPERIAAVLNLDTIAVAGPEAPVAVIGGSPELNALVAQVAAEQGRAFDSDDEADAFARRHDGWVFSEVGVPAALISGSFSDMNVLKAYLTTHYHRASDQVEIVNFEGAAADVRLNLELVRRLADPTFWSIAPLRVPTSSR